MAEKIKRLITLQNGKTEVGVIPDIGGRVSLLRVKGYENVLKADESIWDEPPREKKSFTPFTPWKTFFGHIVWLGPQKKWWSDIDPSKYTKNKLTGWPPDPYLSFGNFEIVEHTSSSVTMVGPKSPFTGMQLTKRISIDKSGQVTFYVKGKNVSKKTVAWDLWLNTRVDGFAKCYVPLSNPMNFHMMGKNTKNIEPMPYRINDDFFTFDTIEPNDDKKTRFSKAFIYPKDSYIAAFTSSQLFLLTCKQYPQKSIHPDQALIEIYNATTSKKFSLMELEFHAPYCTLKPGQSMETEQVWTVLPYKGSDTDRSRINFINKTLLKQ